VRHLVCRGWPGCTLLCQYLLACRGCPWCTRVYRVCQRAAVALQPQVHRSGACRRVAGGSLGEGGERGARAEGVPNPVDDALRFSIVEQCHWQQRTLA